MTSDPNRRGAGVPEAILSTGADQPMNAEQAAALKQLSVDAYELDAFDEHLTRSEAERRIATLRAKLKRIGAPPHTL
jgi:UDP:flavonoid glycosyltransferase YjiC (YdhE family)